MTREAILQEIQALPDEMLESIWTLIKYNLKKVEPQTSQLKEETHKEQSTARELPIIDVEKELTNYKSEFPECQLNNPLPKRQPGIAKGKYWMSDDFDEPLEEMQEYMY